MIKIYSDNHINNDLGNYKESFEIINENFEKVNDYLKDKLKIIRWNSHEDSHKAFSDINDNFEQIFKLINKKDE